MLDRKKKREEGTQAQYLVYTGGLLFPYPLYIDKFESLKSLLDSCDYRDFLFRW